MKNSVIRVYNLSDKTDEEAEFLYQQLAAFVSYPFLMSDKTLKYQLRGGND